MKFNLFHLFLLTLGLAGATIASMTVIGPTVAHATFPTVSSCIAGTLSSAIFVIVSLVVIELFFSQASSHRYGHGTSIPLWVFFVPLTAGVLGGYFGSAAEKRA